MRGIVAKRLRKEVYGDMSLFARSWRWKEIYITGRWRGRMLITDVLRSKYQKLKKFYKCLTLR